MTGKPRYDPKRKDHNVAISKQNYEALQERYPYAEMKALVNHILSEHLRTTI